MGRPSFKPSDEQRAEVERWVKAKLSIEEMARRMELTAKTLRKHFAEELGLIPVQTVNTVLAAARPRTGFHPNDEQREMALILAGAQLSHHEIARKLDISVEVLEEHFAEELERGPIKCKSDILITMFNAGKGGNVAAAKVFLVFNGQGAPDTANEQPARIGMIGKKEAATIAARSAETGTAWEDLPASGKPN